jgi:hypothetical protein
MFVCIEEKIAMNKTCTMAAALVAAVAGVANADFVTANGGGGALNVGTPSFVSDIVITDQLTITEVSISLNSLTHAWAGDVDITLTHLDSGASITIFKKINPGASTFGTSDDFNGNYSFDDDNAGSIWAAASAAGTVIAAGPYFAVDGANVKQFFSIFDGLNSQGTWRLSVVDTFATADDGALGGWTLNIDGTPIPGPGALALLALAGCARGRRRA